MAAEDGISFIFCCVHRYSNNINGLFLFFIAEIGKVRGNLFQINGKKADPLVLPDVAGPPVTLSEKVYVPIKDYPEVNH